MKKAKKIKISVIVPLYNEESTVEEIIKRVQKVKLDGILQEIVIINDSSRDSTLKIILGLAKKHKNIKIISHSRNKGKGAAIRTGLRHSTGEVIVIQDGDLEYNPKEFKRLIKPILEKKTQVVYGSRLLGNVTGFQIPSHYYGNKFLSFVTRILYGRKITDMETCYKMMTSKVARSLGLKSNRFDIEPEITAKILKKGYKILEIPISYNCRSFAEGKKITWKDGIIAICTLFKYRIFD